MSAQDVATHEINLTNEELMTVALGVKDGQYFVRYWNVIRQTTCLPKELYQVEHLPEGYFVNFSGDEVCFRFG